MEERMTDRLLSIKEAALVLNVKAKTLYMWRWKRKNLPFIKVGRSLKVSGKDLKEFIESRKIQPD